MKVTIKLSNTTGKEDRERLVQAFFQPIAALVCVNSFKEVSNKKLIVDIDFLLPIKDAEELVSQAVSAHWQCESLFFEKPFEMKPINAKSLLNFLHSDRSVVNGPSDPARECAPDTSLKR